MPPFSYETYQDVRKNLFYYSAITLNLSGLLLISGSCHSLIDSG